MHRKVIVTPRSLASDTRPSRAVLVGLLAATTLAGCAGLGGDRGAAEADFTLQLLHVADMDGTGGALDDVGAFSALVASFRADYPDTTLFLSAGDNYIPGPRYYAAGAEALAGTLGVAGEGRADIALLNAMGLEASAVGNHELDQGTGAFAALLAPETVGPDDEDERPEGTYPGASFPYLSANLDFAADEDLAGLVAEGGQSAASIAGKLAPSTTLERNGETIGIVGATTPTLAAITSSGDIGIRPAETGDVAALAAEIQSAVDALVEEGVNKIVLLAHMQQIGVEQALAPLLEGVDIIVAGGSNTLLADADDALRPGDEAKGAYPLEFAGADGAPVLLVNVEADYSYLGRLVVGFDESGRIVPDTLDETRNGAWATTEENVRARSATADASVAALADEVAGVLLERDGNIVGRTAVYLDGRRSAVRTEETNMGNLTAEANLWLARQADPATVVSLKNGGGIRAPIGLVVQPPGTVDPDAVEFLPPVANEAAGKSEGDISEFDLQGTLRFNNGLTLLTVTAAELKDILEHAVAASEEGATPGQFPQVAGLAFSFDPARPAREGSDTNGGATVAGERVRSAAVLDEDGSVADTLVQDGALVGDPSRAFRLVILDFIAGCVPDGGECGDGYPLNGLAAPDRVDLGALGVDPGQADFADAGSEQDALAEYLQAFFGGDTAFDEAETAPAEDERMQNLSVREDSVLP